jgi:P-type Cu+ transporter
MSGRYSQAAGDVADVVLLGDRPGQVVEALTLSSATMSKIRQNLTWAFGYNLIGIPIAAGALLPHFGIALSPSISGALMGVSSLAVMGNSLLLKVEAARLKVPGDGEASEAHGSGESTGSEAASGARAEEVTVSVPSSRALSGSAR